MRVFGKDLPLKLGADPELFCSNKLGKIVSAHDMIPGTKENPFKVPMGAVQVDGTALEFNIEPVENALAWEQHLSRVMKELKRMIPEGHDLEPVPIAEYGKEYLDALPPKAVELGCDPDYNAWNGGFENPMPRVETPFRTGAGHIHIGLWEPKDLPINAQAISMQVVKELDSVLGVASVVMDDAGSKRRALYGRAGAMRFKPYGVEYRVLSNFWLKNATLRKWVFKETTEAIKRLHLARPIADPRAAPIINAGDKRNARKYLVENGIKLPPEKYWKEA